MSSPRWHTASADAVLYVQCILNICTTHPHHGGPVFKIHLHSIHSRSNKKELRISGWLSPPWDNRPVIILCPPDIGHYPSCDELRAFSGAYSKRSFKIDLLSIITPRNWKLYFETTTWSTYWQDVRGALFVRQNQFWYLYWYVPMRNLEGNLFWLVPKYISYQRNLFEG